VSAGVVVVGSLNADLVVRVPEFPGPGETLTGTDFAVFPGGKGANQACAAGRLGARVGMVGRVGDDDHGRMLERSLAAGGVDTTGVVRDASVATGTALITIDRSGQNQIVVVPGANALLSPADVEAASDRIRSAGFVLLQLETPLETVEAAARLARSGGAVVILDPAPARVEARRLLALVDYVTPNETELHSLASAAPAEASPEELARELLAAGARNVVTKLGEKGARLVGRDGSCHWPALSVEAVDTTAAGDVWNGAFATALASGEAPERAGRFANAAAALSVTRPGAQPGMPGRSEVEELLRTREAG
jgi:ribokinase